MTDHGPTPLPDSKAHEMAASEMTPGDDSAGISQPASPSASAWKLRRSLTFGVAFLAVATLLGMAGGAGAAGLLTGQDIRDDSLRSADFRNGSIGAAKIRDGGLSPADVSFDLTGDRGPTGVQGPPGPAGIQRITYRTGPAVATSDVGAFRAGAHCAAGEVVLSGGVQLDAAPAGTYIMSSYGIGAGLGPFGWESYITAPAGFKQFTPWVVCAAFP